MSLLDLVDAAMQARYSFFDAEHRVAFRLFNGFLEGCPSLVIDLYARTALIYNFAEPPESGQENLTILRAFLLERFPWLQAIVQKDRHAAEPARRHGQLVYGSQPNVWIQENGICYAIDLLLTLDATFFLDTRLLRQWLFQNSYNKRVLNTFAYTGSLGVAAYAGNARQVIHLDQSRKFLELAKRSYHLNGYEVIPSNFLCGDFFLLTSRLRRSKAKFDIILLDPPFFALSHAGRIDLNYQYDRLINKVRPLLDEGSHLVAVNNALFVSGQEYLAQLEKVCASGYLYLETILPVPEDFTGFPETRRGSLPADPAPFNHATKIAILRSRS